MKASELRQLSLDELRSKSAELRAELFGARMKHETGQLENMAKLSFLRRDVARVETVLRGKLGGLPVSERGQRRTLIGKVVSDKMDKTVVVRVERLVKDPRYHKYVRRYSQFMAHDEENSCAVGDQVRIIEHRPLSKRKRWKVQEMLVKTTGV